MGKFIYWNYIKSITCSLDATAGTVHGKRGIRMSVEERTCRFCGKTSTVNVTTHGGIDYECKNCGNNVHYGDEYCRWCGQKFDWSDAE